MEKQDVKEYVVKTSYYCQSVYTSIDLYIQLIDIRKYDILNNLFIKIIEDTTQCVNFYSKLDFQVLLLDNINNSLKLLVDAYSNLDYFYIKDILEYELLKNIEIIFKNLKFLIENKQQD